MSMVNCNMICIMKNGQRWLHTPDGKEFPIEGFGDGKKKDFEEGDVRKLVFCRPPEAKDDEVVSVIVDKVLTCGYDNVEEIEFRGVKYAYISKRFKNLKKLKLCEEILSFDLSTLQSSPNLEKIDFPERYWKTDYRFFFSVKMSRQDKVTPDTFPKEWSKDLKYDIVAHFPWMVSSLDFVPETKEECFELYTKVCDEAIRRGEERVKTEPKEVVVADEQENLRKVQRWINSCNVKNDSVEASLKDFANSNGFAGYVPPSERTKK